MKDKLQDIWESLLGRTAILALTFGYVPFAFLSKAVSIIN